MKQMRKMIAMVLAAVMALCMLAGMAAAESEWEDRVCEEEGFSTKIPAGGSAKYGKDESGLIIYAEEPGYIPYVIVNRRPLENKFSNPEDFLNNVFREHIENSYGDDCLGMNPAQTMEIGGKKLLGARYLYKVGEHVVTLIRLIEVRDGGDVEYTIKYADVDDQAVMAVAEEAIRNYQETK